MNDETKNFNKSGEGNFSPSEATGKSNNPAEETTEPYRLYEKTDIAEQNIILPTPNDNQCGDLECARPTLHTVASHVSTQDAPVVANHMRDEHYEAGDEIYNKFRPIHKVTMVTILSCCTFISSVSSTAILGGSPEVVATFNTTGTIFNVSNALYLIFMGLSPLLYGPLGTTYGRRWPLIVAGVTFTAFSAGSAAAPNLASYFVFRMLTAFQGTCFLIVGAAAIGDIYKPTERGTAYGWYMSGVLIGPAVGPFIGGIIVTYASWRDIFWLQTAFAGVSTLGVIFLVPETIHQRRSDELTGLSRREKIKKLCSWVNPLRVVLLWRYPNILIPGLASSSMVWNMYSLLTPIQYVLNPRFGLSSPLQGGLFFLAPGAGYFIGAFIGGRWTDKVVKKYIKKRGQRIPEDRLYSGLIVIGVGIPICMVIYGWSIEKKFGGIALPVICMFLQGVGQLFVFPSLNTYSLDVMPKRSAEVVAGNYVIRYAFAAAGSAACLPIIDKIGVGWLSTISALFVAASAVAILCTARYGASWREKAGQRKTDN